VTNLRSFQTTPVADGLAGRSGAGADVTPASLAPGFSGKAPWRATCSLCGDEVVMRVQNPNEVLHGAPRKYVRDDHPERDPQQAPMTLAQASYLMTLCEETNEVLDDSLTRAQADELIKELEDATGRSKSHGPVRVASPIPHH
jgi:hypothetical protein